MDMALALVLVWTLVPLEHRSRDRGVQRSTSLLRLLRLRLVLLPLRCKTIPSEIEKGIGIGSAIAMLQVKAR